MIILLDKINLALFITALLNFFLGLMVYFSGPKKTVNKVYVWNIVFIIGWITAMFFYRSAVQEMGIFWCTFLYVIPTFIASSFLFFTYVFPSQKEKKLWWRALTIFGINLALVVLIAIPDLMIKEVNIRQGLEKEIIFSKLYILYFLYTLFFFSYGFFRLFLKYRQADRMERLQIIYLLIGYALAANLAFVTNLTMPWLGYFFLNWLGQVFTVFMVAFTSYAIIAHRFMDIKLVMRRYSVYLASLTSILIVAVGIKYIFDRYLADYTIWADFFILLISVSVYPAIRNRFYRLANKYFFSSLYDSGEVIAALSDKLRSTLETKIIFGFISETLTNAFHAKAIGVLTYNEGGKKYLLNYNNGFDVGQQEEFDEDKDLNEFFIKRNRLIVTDDIKKQFKNNKTLELLLKIGVEILAPLNVKDKTIGLIALGKKESGDMYNEEDLKVLEVVGAQTAIALENALLYRETKNFSVKMEKEVEKATRDLKKANVQLKKLDAAKSEFISIASHQLRTPLTVIKGYISMMLEGNFGVLTKPETESLEKVFLSNERLIQLVENLLNISRIESGRLQFDYKEVDLSKMVGSVTEELSGNAKKKNLILEYKPPVKPILKIKIDEEKIRQVVMNLIDNGIKYTKQGSVTVKLEQDEKKIKFSVADSGMGIKPEDMVNLFKKFSRGTGTSLIHTEGTGLGLYVARMMIEAHHGKIWAESDGEGKGSKFCFELPIK